ncbi:MAG: hypothetical protein GWN31_11545, partial [Candidatus Thorarchaeota archaeon]|nr:hypothetical protein [Candidatus Thorarchaeota archaeon]
FQDEAHKYIERIEDIIAQMENEYNEELWQQMGITVHTLKGSAQMLDRTDVSKLAAMLEEIIGLVQQGKAP